MNDPGDYDGWMWLFTALMHVRVVGQLIVTSFSPRWLPPKHHWHSGLVPVPRWVVWTSHVSVLILMVWISVHFTREEGHFVRPRPAEGAVAMWFSYAYFGAMFLRYLILMARRPDLRWFGGSIPFFAQCVIAAFIWTYGKYHAG